MDRKERLRGAGCGVLLAMGVAAAPLFAQEPAVATIGKAAISAGELSARSEKVIAGMQTEFDLREHQRKIKFERDKYSARERELNAMIDARVLELEAAARKTTSAALTGAVPVPALPDREIRAFYDANRAQIGQPYEVVSARLKEYLQQQDQEHAKRTYLDSLRKKYDAKVLLEPMREKVEAIGPARGPGAAPVTIVLFSDFQCPFCLQYLGSLEEIRKKYPSQVRVVYRHLPLVELHPNAERAAEASVCANEQDKFWEMHDAMFADQNALSLENLKDKARRLGLESKKFDECLDSGRAKPVVQADKAAADALGLGATPASFVNGRFVNGSVPAADLGAIIEDELRRQGGSGQH